MPAGIGQPLDRLGLGVVPEPQFDGIHVQGIGQLVHRAFQGEDVRRLGRRAHEAGRVAVGVDDADLGSHVRAGVEPGRGVRPGDHVVVRPAGELPAFVDQCGQASVAAGGQANPVAGRGAIGGDGEPLRPGGDQLHRPVQPLGRQGDDRRALGQRTARAEGAADVGRDHMHVVRRDAQLLGDSVLEAPDILAGFPDGQLAA